MCHNLQISINIQIRKFVYTDVGSTQNADHSGGAVLNAGSCFGG